MKTTIQMLLVLLGSTLPMHAWPKIDGPQQLQLHYQAMQQARQDSTWPHPFAIHSSDRSNRLSADVYGIVAYPFAEVKKALSSAANWCEFMPLNLNIKSCTIAQHAGQTELTLYAGRKFYEAPEDAYQLKYGYRVLAQDEQYLSVLLSAGHGPFGTSDYRIAVEAIPVQQKTFLLIHSSYTASWQSKLGAKTYLATLGQGKIGFSVEALTAEGTPIYSTGTKAVIERNVMRYYLALTAYLDTQHLPAAQRFEARIQTWFDMTGQYAAQLHELERDEYLQAKRQEWANQLHLQQQLHP
ncbi:MAG: hypothetical protein AB1810_14735 [Pseudomonadota bacterium]